MNRHIAIAALLSQSKEQAGQTDIKPHSGVVNKRLASMWSSSEVRAKLLSNLTTKELKRRKLMGMPTGLASIASKEAAQHRDRKA